MSVLQTSGALPGITAAATTVENTVVWGGAKSPLLEFDNYPIDSAAVDSGSTPTTILRPGLVLGKVTSTGRLLQYSATATDGSQVPFGVLMRGLSMLDLNGVVENKFARVIVAGSIKGGSLYGLDQVARRLMVQCGKFIFDDDTQGQAGFGGLAFGELAKTADYTIVAADNNRLFTNTGAAGAVNFTLPTLAVGLAFEFQVVAAQNVTVTSAAGTDIVWDGNAGRSSLAFSTGSHQIGGRLLVHSNAAGTKWYARNYSPAGCTITAA
jgi:hypothetical protein